MAGPYKNNMQEKRIRNQFLYKFMDVILLVGLGFFLRKGEQEENYTGILRNERKGWIIVEVNWKYMQLELFT